MEKYIVFKKSELESFLRNNPHVNYDLVYDYLMEIGKEILKGKKEVVKKTNKTAADCIFSIPGFNSITHKIEK
jgi:hypothetical protein